MHKPREKGISSEPLQSSFLSSAIGKRRATAAATGGGGAGVEVVVRWLNSRNTTGAWLIEGGRNRGWQQSRCRQFKAARAPQAALYCPYFGPVAKRKTEWRR